MQQWTVSEVFMKIKRMYLLGQYNNGAKLIVSVYLIRFCYALEAEICDASFMLFLCFGNIYYYISMHVRSQKSAY